MKILIRNITGDKIVFLFTVFSFLNVLSYSWTVLFGSNLLIPRLVLLFYLLFLLIKKGLNLDYFLVSLPLLCFFCLINIAFLFSENLENSIQVHFGIISYVLVSFFFVVYLQLNYKNYFEIVVIVILFSYIHIPLLLLFNPQLVSLNLYGSNLIETVGLKSRFLGWSCALLIPSLLYLNYRRVILIKFLWLIPILIFFTIISGSRSSLLSILVVFVLYIILYPRNTIKVYFLLFAIFGLVFLLNFTEEEKNEISFFKRQENLENGVAEEGYRVQVFEETSRIMSQDFKFLILGFGPGNFNEILRKKSVRFVDNELSTHNTFLEVAASYGIIVFSLFCIVLVVKPLHISWKQGDFKSIICIVPIVMISVTENNFGAGQFLFLPLLVSSFCLGINLRTK